MYSSALSLGCLVETVAAVLGISLAFKVDSSPKTQLIKENIYLSFGLRERQRRGLVNKEEKFAAAIRYLF